MICAAGTRRVASRSMRRSWLCFSPCVNPVTLLISAGPSEASIAKFVVRCSLFVVRCSLFVVRDSEQTADATGTQASPPATPWLPRRQTSRLSSSCALFRASHSCRRGRLRSSRIRRLPPHHNLERCSTNNEPRTTNHQLLTTFKF